MIYVKGYEWNRISRRDRSLLGRLFLNHVKLSKILFSQLKKLRLVSKSIGLEDDIVFDRY